MHWNMAQRDDDESKRHSKLAKSPPPSCRRQGRLARASFSGPAKLSTLFPGRPLCAHVEGHNLGGYGKPHKLRGPLRGSKGPRCPVTGGTSCGRVSLSLAGPAGLWPFDAPPGPWRPGTEGPWAFQRGARAEPGVERDEPDDPRSGAAGAGSFSGDSVGLSFSRDQRGLRVFQDFRFLDRPDISLLVGAPPVYSARHRFPFFWVFSSQSFRGLLLFLKRIPSVFSMMKFPQAY